MLDTGMRTKICTKCQEPKLLNQFWLRKGQPRSICKTCQTSYFKKWKKTDAGKASKKRNRKHSRDRKQRLLSELGITGCARCPESYYRCLDFHHSNGEKEGCLARMIRDEVSMRRLIAEAKKCTVLCANCHRKEHYPSEMDNSSSGV